MSNSIIGSSFVGFGLYISAIAGIGVLGSAYLLRSPTDNIRDSFNNIKKDIENKMGNTGKTNEPPVNTPENPNNINPPL